MPHWSPPNPRSVLFFITECFRVEDEEEAWLPSWAFPVDVTSSVFRAAHEADPALFARHAARSSFTSKLARGMASSDLIDLLSVTSETDIPPALLDRHASMIESALRWRDRETATQREEESATRRRSAEALASLELRQNTVVALAGLYLGCGLGDKGLTAKIAREGTPTADSDKVQWWHVRDAMKAYVRPFARYRLEPPPQIEVKARAALAVIRVGQAMSAWDRLRSEPDYAPSQHTKIVERVASSGQLAQWLHEIGDRTGDQMTQERAAKLLGAYLLDQRARAIFAAAERLGLDFSQQKTAHRNAMSLAASSASRNLRGTP